MLAQELFQRAISLERKRTERSQKPFLLMLVCTEVDSTLARKSETLDEVASALLHMTRETDAVGWYQNSSIVGAMFTELAIEDGDAIGSAIFTRVSSTLRDHLTREQFDGISISLHVFPEEWDRETPEGPSNPMLYPDLFKRNEARKVPRFAKRAMDIFGSILLLILGSPIFVLIALAVKLTSKGSIFYRQRRVGECGVPFSLLKFRSMYEGNDCSIHKAYVQQLIAGVAEKHPGKQNGEGVYKLTRDPRITPVGAFLRRTSMDELPQLLNVLTGEMSLVGPRPPVDYEIEKYELWHRRRVLEAKPGITGLWQVNGRNRVAFDDMVRLDLLYAKAWTPWLDLKIILRTPKAIVEGAH
jgi:lipopolysaccharide/colanic/teichoic acid biosynthesis glycosyltransferase